MRATLVRNAFVAGALLVATCVLVALEVRVLPVPPSGIWFVFALALALLGFVWANLATFRSLTPQLRCVAIGTSVLGLWAIASLLAVVVGVNLKFALGGHV